MGKKDIPWLGVGASGLLIIGFAETGFTSLKIIFSYFLERPEASSVGEFKKKALIP